MCNLYHMFSYVQFSPFKNTNLLSSQTSVSEFPLNATTTFLQEVKHSPSSVKLLSHSSTQQIKPASTRKNISIVKSPITVAPSINTGTTTIYLPVFNAVSAKLIFIFTELY